MNCAWKNKTKQNKNDSKAELSFYVFTQMKLGDDRMKIQADVTQYMEPTVFRTALFAYGLQNSELKKSQPQRISPSGSFSFSQERTIYAFVKKSCL